MGIVSECAEKSSVWRQVLAVRGDSLRLLESRSNIAAARRDPEANTLILRGNGAWFPNLYGASWAAMCVPHEHHDRQADDLSPILRTLLDAELMPMSDAAPAEIAEWLRGDAR